MYGKTRKTIKVGTHVLYRCYNTPSHKFYGEMKQGIVKKIFYDESGEKKFEVAHKIGEYELTITLHRKEIKAILPYMEE